MKRTAETGYRCECTTAFQALCDGDDFYERDADGRCGCPCHEIYSDDPENWQPLRLQSTAFTDAEIAEMDDWLGRIEAAEALIDEEADV